MPGPTFPLPGSPQPSHVAFSIIDHHQSVSEGLPTDKFLSVPQSGPCHGEGVIGAQKNESGDNFWGLLQNFCRTPYLVGPEQLLLPYSKETFSSQNSPMGCSESHTSASVSS